MCAGSSADVECFMVYSVPLIQQCRSSWLLLAVSAADSAVLGITVYHNTLQHEQSSCSKLAGVHSATSVQMGADCALC
jgi:hypothetical protein